MEHLETDFRKESPTDQEYALAWVRVAILHRAVGKPAPVELETPEARELYHDRNQRVAYDTCMMTVNLHGSSFRSPLSTALKNEWHNYMALEQIYRTVENTPLKYRYQAKVVARLCLLKDELIREAATEGKKGECDGRIIEEIGSFVDQFFISKNLTEVFGPHPGSGYC